jgi:uncharacterized membrane protein YadS
MAALGTLHLIPELRFSGGGFFTEPVTIDVAVLLQGGGKFLLTLAMTAIGLQVGLGSMIRAGRAAILFAALIWMVLSGVIVVFLRLLAG